MDTNGAEQYIPIKSFCFPVDTDKFNNGNKVRDKVFIYFKRRQPKELQFIEDYLKKMNIEYVIFDYIKRYKEEDYISYLQESKYGLILDAHESQGFSIQEASQDASINEVIFTIGNTDVTFDWQDLSGYCEKTTNVYPTKTVAIDYAEGSMVNVKCKTLTLNNFPSRYDVVAVEKARLVMKFLTT